jgi:type I restriction-modification system DNA methylase subunit
MNLTRLEIINNYRQKVVSANKVSTKKEAFNDLLNRLYSNNKDIDKITLGAGTYILDIPRKNKTNRGSADTLFNSVIIEFENNLKTTGNHAKEQLAGHLLGLFKPGKGYNYTLIASDFIEWKIYAPDISCLDKLDSLNERELLLNEMEKSSFTLTENNAGDFYYWLDRFIFKEESQRATLKRIEDAFGYQSPVFIESFRELDKWFNEAKKSGEVQVSFEQWSKFLSIAYGNFDASEKNFLIHTYLSVFSKLLAHAVVSNDEYIDDDELHKVLDGTIFHKYNINNFVENDFFHWIKDRSFNNLKKTFRLIAQEISTFDFTSVDEDVLKGVYQELIDLDTRHSLGEYYTPDWLCQRVASEFNFKPADKILDPSCGSGSFLRAIIHRLKELNPDMDPEQLNNAVYGIDIHPLSVQIAKTTVLIALKDNFTKCKNPIKINVILANTLLTDNLLGNEFTMSTDMGKLIPSTKPLDNDSMVDNCGELGKFDYVVGNPPWFTYSSVKNEEYQEILDSIAEKYKIMPQQKDYPHLEIAAIFMAYCNNFFLKNSGKLAFVLPRSFFSGSQHDNTRSGIAEGFKINSIWDLNDVSPLFRIPSCVLFTEKASSNRALPEKGLHGLQFHGTVPTHNCNYEVARMHLTENKAEWFYVQQGKSSAFSKNKVKKQNRVNPYKNKFKQGATIVPRTFYFVELNQENPPDFNDGILNVKTAESVKIDAKAPWKDTSLSAQIESRFLFRTALSKSILPFNLYNPELVMLPIIVDVEKQVKLVSGESLYSLNCLNAASWFSNTENIWSTLRTEKNRKISGIDYLNWQNKLVDQNLKAPYLVLYNASAKDANATVVRREDIDLEFIVESVAYVFFTPDENEAYYLTAILNSKAPNEQMKDFQAKELFGARHVHKKILDVYFPKFDENDKNHMRLALLSKTAHDKTALYLKDNPPQKELTAMHLGRLRVAIKKHLDKEMTDINEIVKQIID